MSELHSSIDLPYSIDKLWSVLPDLNKYDEWMTIHTGFKGDVPAIEDIKVGTKFSEIVTLMGMANTVEWTVQEFTPADEVLSAKRGAFKLGGTGMAGGRGRHQVQRRRDRRRQHPRERGLVLHRSDADRSDRYRHRQGGAGGTRKLCCPAQGIAGQGARVVARVRTNHFHGKKAGHMLDWSPIDLAVRDAVRQFIDKEVRPHVDALESGEMEPYPIIRKMFATFGIDALAKEGLQKQIEKKKAREAALAAGEQPAESKKSDGGGAMGLAGGSAGMGFVLTSEISRVCMGLVTGMGVSMGLTVPTIASRGTAAQMERWLPELVTYEKVGAWAITEPDSGSDAFGGMKTYVTRDGEDYILNGQKTFITNGPDADVIVVYAKLNEGAGKDSVDPRDRKVLTFVLDKGMEGFTQSKPFRKMGIHSSRTGQLFFENVRLGKDRLLGETETNDQGDGRDSARANFSMERIGVAALALGVIEECLRLSLDYAKSRTLWGKEIAQFQLIQLKLAKMEVARLNVRNMLFHAIESLSENKTPSLAEASAIKLYCSEAATDVAMDAVQLFGGNGYMTEYRVEQLARDAKSLMIYAGSNEVQITHIAKGLLADKAR